MPNELKILNGIDVETVLKSLPQGDHVNAMWFCNAAAAIESALLAKLRGGVELPDGKEFIGVEEDPTEDRPFNFGPPRMWFTRDQLLQYGDARALAAREQAIEEAKKRVLAEPVELIAKWRVAEIIGQRAAPPVAN